MSAEKNPGKEVRERPDWDACANRHLLAHIIRQSSRRVFYCHPSDIARPFFTPKHPLSHALARILRSHAHCWGLDMADLRPAPTASEQRASFEKAMELADKECRKSREASSAPPVNALPSPPG